MNATVLPLLGLLILQAATPVTATRSFHWDWHQQQDLFKAKSLRDTELPPPDKETLAKVIEEEIRPNMSYLRISSEDQLLTAALDTRVVLVNLGPGGSQEVVEQVDGLCSADGNCPLSFFQKTPCGYKLLIESIGQSFTILPTSTNGFKDLVVAMHGSAIDKWLKVYRYARGRYWRAACYDADWAPLGKDGEVHELKEPRITPEPCR